MPNNILSGRDGEQFIVDKIRCCNCGKKLMRLPSNYPMFDVQCTGCSFRAQVKTNQCRPKDEVFGAGWDIVEKVMKAGYTIPPLIVLFSWLADGNDHKVILFYPFIPRANLRRRQLSPSARRANYRMFNYIGLRDLPHFTLLDTRVGQG